MGKTTTLALLLALALALAVPQSAAAAARVLAPPGNAEADQYYETVPSPTGPRAPDTTKKARDAVREGVLGEAAERGLRQRGPAGLALATAVAQTALPGGPGAAGRPRLGSWRASPASRGWATSSRSYWLPLPPLGSPLPSPAGAAS